MNRRSVAMLSGYRGASKTMQVNHVLADRMTL